jgi:hypothetical protein
MASKSVGWPSWRYDGPPRIYTNVPVTVQAGDVIAWPEPPADDGCWKRVAAAPTRTPDNYVPDPQDAPAAETVKEG